jgi:hypothetical protein
MLSVDCFVSGEVGLGIQTDKKAEKTTEAGPRVRKLPYKKPAFRFEGVFETMALACGKNVPTQAQCRVVRKTS